MSNYEIKKMIQANTKYKKKRQSNVQTDVNYIDFFNDSMINIVKDDDDLIDFKGLDTEIKLELLDKYFNNKNISEKDKELIISLVKNKIIKNKNDIIYDRVNKVIKRIPMLEINNDTNQYSFKEKKTTVKKTSSKKKVNKLLIG